MQYHDLLLTLVAHDFRRIERDDRLLDIFPGEDREKGVELWEKWTDEVIHLVRIRVPFAVKKLAYYQLPRQDIEQALLQNDVVTFDEYSAVATGADVKKQLSF